MHKRVFKFVSLLESGSVYNKICLQLAINGSTSRMCNTINYACNKYNITKQDLLFTGPHMWHYKIINYVKPTDSTLFRDMLYCIDRCFQKLNPSCSQTLDPET